MGSRNASQILLSRAFIKEAHNSELVLVGRGGLICDCPMQPAQDRWYDTGAARRPRLLLCRPKGAPSYYLLHDPRWDKARCRRDILDLCAQHHWERVADSAGYRLVRLGIPVELARCAEEFICLRHEHVGGCQPGAIVCR